MVALHTAGWTRFFQKLPPLLLAWPSEPLECVPSAFPCLPGAPRPVPYVPFPPVPPAPPGPPASPHTWLLCPPSPFLWLPRGRQRPHVLPVPGRQTSRLGRLCSLFPTSYPHSLRPTARLTGRVLPLLLSSLVSRLVGPAVATGSPLVLGLRFILHMAASVVLSKHNMVAARRGFVQTQIRSDRGSSPSPARLRGLEWHGAWHWVAGCTKLTWSVQLSVASTGPTLTCLPQKAVVLRPSSVNARVLERWAQEMGVLSIASWRKRAISPESIWRDNFF